MRGKGNEKRSASEELRGKKYEGRSPWEEIRGKIRVKSYEGR